MQNAAVEPSGTERRENMREAALKLVDDADVGKSSLIAKQVRTPTGPLRDLAGAVTFQTSLREVTAEGGSEARYFEKSDKEQLGFQARDPQDNDCGIVLLHREIRVPCMVNIGARWRGRGGINHTCRLTNFTEQQTSAAPVHVERPTDSTTTTPSLTFCA
ncbi:hypothetical protein Trydic_g5879 [Trypoxylus dichotomus]